MISMGQTWSWREEFTMQMPNVDSFTLRVETYLTTTLADGPFGDHRPLIRFCRKLQRWIECIQFRWCINLRDYPKFYLKVFYWDQNFWKTIPYLERFPFTIFKFFAFINKFIKSSGYGYLLLTDIYRDHP